MPGLVPRTVGRALFLPERRYARVHQAGLRDTRRLSGFPKTEIKPLSELDFFLRFRNMEFHFFKDQTGKVTQLEFGSNRNIKALKVN